MIILSYGDDPYTSTGYGQIWENLLKRWVQLRPDWKFLHVGWQNRDRPHETKEGYTLLPIKSVEYGIDTIAEYLIKYNPDFLITMADIGIQAGFIDGVLAARKSGWRGKWIAYNPFDTKSWERMLWDKILDMPDINVAMADNGEILMTKEGVHNVKQIKSGVDTKTFFPLADKEELKKKFNLNKFVVGFIGKNQRRKAIANLIKGFSQFSKGKSDVVLLLHTEANSGMGWNIPSLVFKFEHDYDSDLNKGKVTFSKENLDTIGRQMVQPNNINELYNLMDLFCYATGGEGFGLPGLECQSAGVPLMMTADTTAFELAGTHGILIPILKDQYGREVTEIGLNGIENTMPNDKAIAELLEVYYNDWKTGGKILKEKSEQARNFALKYDWDFLAPKWIELFENEI